MKIIQRNKIKFKVFDEDELRYQLRLSEDDIKLVNNYQTTFIELMVENGQGFCIDARQLFNQLKLNETSTKFADWIKNVFNTVECIEEKDFIRFKTKNPNGGRPSVNYSITLDVAKEICMITGMVNSVNKETKQLSKMVRKYFILIEKTLKNYEEWIQTREPEKQSFNIMRREIKNWCERHGYDSTLEIFYTRESNLINEKLTGFKASELKIINNCKTNITRDYLEKATNEAIYYLEELNIQLLLADMSFDDRSKIIENYCKNKYKDLYIKK